MEVFAMENGEFHGILLGNIVISGKIVISWDLTRKHGDFMGFN